MVLVICRGNKTIVQAMGDTDLMTFEDGDVMIYRDTFKGPWVMKKFDQVHKVSVYDHGILINSIEYGEPKVIREENNHYAGM